MSNMRRFLVPTTVVYKYIFVNSEKEEISILLSKTYQVLVHAFYGQDAAEQVDKMSVGEIEEICGGEYTSHIDNIEGDDNNVWNGKSVEEIEEAANFKPKESIISQIGYAYEA